MTIVIDASPGTEEVIAQEAARAGLSLEDYILRAAIERAAADAGKSAAVFEESGSGSLADAIKPFLGSVGGSVGPNDGTGRPWSEIEAVNDPL